MEQEHCSNATSPEQASTSRIIDRLRRVRDDMLAHAEEKLYRLRSEYMRTEAARSLALPLENELRALLEAITRDDGALVNWTRRALEMT